MFAAIRHERADRAFGGVGADMDRRLENIPLGFIPYDSYMIHI
ncbi:MAG: hypothetical protein V4512_14600 [Pseudomonadota bacterium]